MGIRQRYIEAPKQVQKGLCRWCLNSLTGRRTSWCGERCIHEYSLRSDGSYMRRCVYKRDKGICAFCNLDTDKLVDELWKLQTRDHDAFMKKLEEMGVTHRFFNHRGATLYDVDHIIPVFGGGGGAGMDNLQTLCWKCHKAKSLKDRKLKITPPSIAIDIDSTLAKTYATIADIIYTLFSIKVTESMPKNWQQWSWPPLTDDQFNQTLDALHAAYLDKIDPMDFAAQSLRRLKNIGLQINIVTARPKGVRLVTQMWLKKNHIIYDRLTFSSEKLPLPDGCIAIVEDNEETVKKASSMGYDCIWFNTHNKPIDMPSNVFVVKSWAEAMPHIEKIWAIKQKEAQQKYLASA